jgi:hypothetical protein
MPVYPPTPETGGPLGAKLSSVTGSTAEEKAGTNVRNRKTATNAERNLLLRLFTGFLCSSHVTLKI